MDKPHQLISRPLSGAEYTLMKDLDALDVQLQAALDRALGGGADPRSIATARTHVDTAMMWAGRGIAKPGRM